MPKKIKAKDLAKVCSLLRHFRRIDVKVEHLRGGTTRTLSEVRPDISAKGRPTTRTIQAVEDGCQRYFDGNYEFEVTALLVGSERLPFAE